MKPDADAAAPAAVLVTSAAKPLLDPEPIAMPRSHAAETQTQPTGPCRHPQDRLAPHLLTLRGMLLEQRSFTPPCSLPSSSSRSTPDLADPPGAL
jgi:hypothetical protein